MLNKFKEFYKNTYGMLITLSWILLIICLIIKLFGGNWFELNSENSKFIEFCLYVDNNLWLKQLLGALTYLISGYISLCPILNVKYLNQKQTFMFIPLMILKVVLSWYNSIIAFCIDIFILLVLTTLINKNFKRTIISFLLINAFQIIALLIRNMGVGIGDFNFQNSFIYQILIQIDYYVMLILFYLYNTKKLKKGE